MDTNSALSKKCTGIMKEKRISAYSHFQPVLDEARKAAGIVSTYFEINNLKSETRKLAANLMRPK